MVEDGAFSHKIDFFSMFKEILTLEQCPHCITGSRVMAILLKRWILLLGGASSVEGLPSTGLSPLFCYFIFELLLCQQDSSTK